ncbi:hypothetical protein GCM10027187_39840 [Streptosporangium sandarakinum]|uniref:2'-5' RNA ligase n=1 Tax=Streptosporangium sandarakinum TaxID=1260955 RepID=A0A852VEQ2_9ACTN|nr:2'-5' RNA ligase family protein [Streptosporangium sandarakinum]NYF44685.1 2'-5' RNA ligase [Streptosporangium sandarakinum]
MTVRLERKSVAVSPGVLADAPKGTVTCLVAITGVLDNVGDIIMPGAFSRTLAQRRPKGVFAHDTTTWVSRAELVEEWMPGDPRLPARTKDGQPWPAEAGAVFVRALFNLKTKDGREAYERVVFYSESNECEWSIGYSVPAGGARKDPKTGVRRIYDLDWYEFSPVLFGAASQTMTLAVKSGMPGVVDTPQDEEAVRRLRNWYVRGEGAARIGWETPGAFERCVALAGEHMMAEQARGFCAERHHDTTGRWPGRHERKADPAVDSWDELLASYTDDPPTDPVADADAGGEAGETQGGPRAMVSLTVPTDVAQDLAVDGGLPPSELHVTLAYLGEGVEEDALADAAVVVEQVAAEYGALLGRLGGIGAFPDDEQEGTPIWVPVDVPGLVELRQRLLAALDEAGIWYSTTHGFTPHVTLAYLEPGEPLPDPVSLTPVGFNALTLAVEDDHEDFPLTSTGTGAAAAATGPADTDADMDVEAEETPDEEEMAVKRLAGWQVKAGRVLSDRNLRRLQQAADILREIMKDAGAWDGDEHDPTRRQPPEMPPEPTITPDSTAPSALPTEIKTVPLTAEQVRAGWEILEFLGR